MRPLLWISAALAIAFASHAAMAADVKAVLDACDRTPGCGYSINKDNGDISGCSSKTCFYCANDGKRECIQVREQPTSGKPKPIAGPDNLLTNMGAASMPVKPKLEKGAATSAAPAASQ